MKTPELKNISQLVFLGCVIFSSLAALPYVTSCAGHTCDGQCPVCMQIRGVLDLLKLLNAAITRLGLAAAVFGLGAAMGKNFSIPAVPVSPVALKVRMNS
jgi:hypothetical protein